MIIYGYWTSHKFIGVVTDECPVCKRQRHFKVERRKIWMHLYFIPFIPGLTSGYPVSGTTCGCVIKRKLRNYPQLERRWWCGWRVVPGWKEPLPDDLEMPDDLATARQQEAYIEGRHDPLTALAHANRPYASDDTTTAEHRMAQIREPFLQMNQAFETRAAEQHFDRQSGLGCFASLALPIIPMVLSFNAKGATGEFWKGVALVIFSIFAIYTFWKLHTDVGRWFRKNRLSRIVSSLRSLEPTREELQQVIGEFKELKLKMGKHIDPEEVYEAIRARR